MFLYAWLDPHSILRIDRIVNQAFKVACNVVYLASARAALNQ